MVRASKKAGKIAGNGFTQSQPADRRAVSGKDRVTTRSHAHGGADRHPAVPDIVLNEGAEDDEGFVRGRITIPAPKFEVHGFQIVGISPLVINRFGAKTVEQLRQKQLQGSVANSKKERKAKDFEACFEDAKHVHADGWYGFPAPGFRSAMIRAAQLVGFKMTMARMSVFIMADGIGTDGTPLVRLETGEPEMFVAPVRNATGVVDIRARPMFREWGATVRIRWDSDQFAVSDVANLLLRAGVQVGIGEGRPFSKKSDGQGWGQFELADE